MNDELRAGEDLFKKTKGSTWKLPEKMREQRLGDFIFTNQRIIFHSCEPYKKAVTYAIEYKDIKSIQPVRFRLFQPTDITITTYDKKEYIISIKQQKKYLAYIHQFLL